MVVDYGEWMYITAGLGESMTHVWSGDVDLADGKLQSLYDEYIERRKFVERLGLDGRQGRWDINIDLATLKSQLKDDMEFITSGMCVCAYCVKTT